MNLKYTLLLCGMCYQVPVYANSISDCDIEKNIKITTLSPASFLPCFASPSADLVLQLALNERISQYQLINLAQSLKTVINPSQVVFYHTNEPDRLARACIYLFLREELSDAFITQWLEDMSLPPNGSWEAAYQSKKGLAAMHNVKGFLGRLLLTSYDKQNERIALVHAHALTQLRRVR